MLFRKTAIEKGPLCVVVPDARAVEAMQQRLAKLYGGAYLGHSVYTFEGLAHDILTASESAPEPVSTPVKRAILTELVKGRMGAGSRYEGIASYPGFVTLFIAWLEDTRSGSVSMSTEDSELSALANAYADTLSRLNLDDHEGIVLKALEDSFPEIFAERFGGAFILDGFYDLTPKQLELVRRLVEAFPRSVATLPIDNKRQDLFSLPLTLLKKFQAIGAKTVDVTPDYASFPDSVLAAFHSENHKALQSNVNGSIELHTFRNTNSEADWLAGYIRDMIARDNVNPRDIMLVSRFNPSFGTPLVMSLLRYGVPVEGGISRRLTTAPVVRLALDALDAAIHPENEALLKKVQRSSYTLGKEASARDLLEGIDEKGWSCRIAEFDTPEGYAASLKNVLDDLGVSHGLTGRSGESAFFDLASYETLIESLDNFAEITGSFRKMMRASEFSALLANYLASVALPMSMSPGQGVLVADVQHARYTSRKITVMTGLDDSSYPYIESGYSLLGQAVAQKIRTERKMEEPLLFYSAAIGATKLILTFSGIDDEGGDSSMSPYLRELITLATPAITPQFHAAVPGASWEGGPRDKAGEGECLIRILKQNQTDMSSIAQDLSRKKRTLYDSMIASVNAYTALLSAPDIDISNQAFYMNMAALWGEDRIFSVTALEMYSDCPVKFYFSRIVGLDVYKPSPGEIEPLVRGNIIHDILAAFFTAVSEREWHTSLPLENVHETKSIMYGIVDTVFDNFRVEMSSIHALAILSERKALHTLMEHFVEAETERLGDDILQPESFEVPFGRAGKNDDDEPYPPLETGEEGESIRIGGRIDRIDRGEVEGSEYFRIIDYKTGAEVKASATELRAGTALQAPLYIEAVRKSIKPEAKVFDGALYSLREMKLKPYIENRKALQMASWDFYVDQAISLVRDSVRSIRAGVFPTPEGDCAKKRCEFISVCRGGCHKTKLTDLDNK